VTNLKRQFQFGILHRREWDVKMDLNVEGFGRTRRSSQESSLELTLSAKKNYIPYE
jgi:hypothetical protein